MSPDNERAEKGREILKSRAAQGEPGTKQSEHASTSVSAEEAIAELKSIEEKYAAPTRGPSADDTENHPVAPEERHPGAYPADTAAAATAAVAIGNARAAIENSLVTEARLASDPRRERDQKVYEMGQRGELGFVPAAPKDEAPPTTATEEVAADTPRLEAGEKAAAAAKSGQIKPGEQEVNSTPRPPQPEDESEGNVKHQVR